MRDENKTREQLINQLVEVLPGVIVVQLNGKQDSQSMQQLTEQLRGRIEQTNSSVAVVDVTGVANTDTKMAQHLVNAISSVRLQGAKVILTGVQPTIAKLLMHLGVDLSEVLTHTSLVAGLWAALDIVESRATSKTYKREITTRHEGKTKEQLIVESNVPVEASSP